MKKIILHLVILSLTGVIIFLSCKREISCEGCINGNKPPIAVAGPDQVVTLPTDSVSLDGNASSDPDGTISEWLWTKISGPASFNFSNASIAKTVVKNLSAGTYQLELKVTDDKGLYAKDTVQVIVDTVVTTNHPPVANAGADQTITLPTNSVTIDGSASTDPDNNITSYVWIRISGPSSFNILNANAVQTQINILTEGVYQFELKVTDAGGLISKDTTNVQVNVLSDNLPACAVPSPPIIQATLTQIGTLSVPRIPTAGAVGNKVVFAGGWSGINCTNGEWFFSSTSSAVDIYDMQTQSWSSAQLSTARAGIRSISCGNKIFFAGGEDGLSTVYDNVDIYDISTNTWVTQHLSVPRAYVATASIGNKVLFAGGYFYTGASSSGYPNGISNIVDIYDISANQWSTATLAGTAWGLYTATAVNDKVYFAGGNNNGIINIYDNSTNSWSTSDLQFQGWQGGVVPFFQNPITSFAVEDNIYWAGHVDEGGMIFPYDYTGRAEVRNIISNTTTIKCFPLFFSQYPVFRNNEVAFFSSYQNQGWRNEWSTVETFPIYNTLTGNWSTGTANFDFYNYNLDAGIVSTDNTIYVGGGYGFIPLCIAFTDKVYILNW
jgi:hypothetical protein